MEDLDDYEKSRKNPRGTWRDVGRSSEALRLGYLLLWNFANRLKYGNAEVLDEDFFRDLFSFNSNWADTESEKSLNYEKLMVELCDELNFFINGAPFPEKHNSFLDLSIQDPRYLDFIAHILGGLDGIVGFILAGNSNCSRELLMDLAQSDYVSLVDSDSTRKRAQEFLEWKQ